jgi:regulator of protease activity HflC (stomatin/prohibitin superfamily)
MIREIERSVTSGYLAVVLLFALTVATVYLLIRAANAGAGVQVFAYALALLIVLVSWFGLFIVNPNEAKVLQLFGDYVGTVRNPGLKYANPFYTKRKVSVRVRNFETGKLKVNDRHSNPIEIATVVVWRVVDTAEAMFEVDDYSEYVHVQSEAALRGMATNYPYDAHEENELSLSGNAAEISDQLKTEIQERLAKAGVEVLESRISHLAYAPEIASAMLQRQQASAIIAARKKIVEGAVGMVEMALADLSARKIIELDDERKAQMVGNLLVVLCSDRNPQPVLNTGSIY